MTITVVVFANEYATWLSPFIPRVAANKLVTWYKALVLYA